MFEFIKSLLGINNKRKSKYAGEDFRIKNIQDLCRNESGIIQPYNLNIIDRKSYQLSVYKPCPQVKISYARFDWRTDNYIELFPDSIDSVEGFVDLFDENLKLIKDKGAHVYKYTIGEYRQMKLYISDNETSGFAIKQDGEINSIFSSAIGSLHAMIELAIQNGGNKLYCFDTFLPDIFKRHGFKEVRRFKWDDTTMPDILYKEYFKQYDIKPDLIYFELALDQNVITHTADIETN